MAKQVKHVGGDSTTDFVSLTGTTESSWNIVNKEDLQNITMLASNPTRKIIIGFCNNSLAYFYSDDDGATWSIKRSPVTTIANPTYACLNFVDDRFFLITTTGINFCSLDGLTWSANTTLSSNVITGATSFHVAGVEKKWFVIANGLRYGAKSTLETNGTITWTEVTVHASSTAVGNTRPAIAAGYFSDANTTRTFIIATGSGDTTNAYYLYSTDDGATWTQAAITVASSARLYGVATVPKSYGFALINGAIGAGPTGYYLLTGVTTYSSVSATEDGGEVGGSSVNYLVLANNDLTYLLSQNRNYAIAQLSTPYSITPKVYAIIGPTSTVTHHSACLTSNGYLFASTGSLYKYSYKDAIFPVTDSGWTSASFVATSGTQNCTVQVSGQYVAIGWDSGGSDLVLMSSNYGESFTTSDAGTSGTFRSCIANNKAYFFPIGASNTPRMSSSFSGVLTDLTTLPVATGGYIAYGANTYVYTNQSYLYTSSDGTNFTSRTVPWGGSNYSLVVYFNSYFYAFIRNANFSTLYRSSDGISWTSHSTGPTISAIQNAYIVDNRLFLYGGGTSVYEVIGTTINPFYVSRFSPSNAYYGVTDGTTFAITINATNRIVYTKDFKKFYTFAANSVVDAPVGTIVNAKGFKVFEQTSLALRENRSLQNIVPVLEDIYNQPSFSTFSELNKNLKTQQIGNTLVSQSMVMTKNGRFIFQPGTSGHVVYFNSAYFCASNTSIFKSSDGASWYTVLYHVQSHASLVVMGSYLYWFCSSANSSYRTSDGVNWEILTHSASSIPSGTCVATNGTIAVFAMSGAGNNIYYGAAGGGGGSYSLPYSTRIIDIHYIDSKFVMFSYNVSGSLILTSDFSTYTYAPLPKNALWGSSQYIPASGTLYIMADDGSVYSTTDTVNYATWTMKVPPVYGVQGSDSGAFGVFSKLFVFSDESGYILVGVSGQIVTGVFSDRVLYEVPAGRVAKVTLSGLKSTRAGAYLKTTSQDVWESTTQDEVADNATLSQDIFLGPSEQLIATDGLIHSFVVVEEF